MIGMIGMSGGARSARNETRGSGPGQECHGSIRDRKRTFLRL
jgi:hypothetical protein